MVKHKKDDSELDARNILMRKCHLFLSVLLFVFSVLDSNSFAYQNEADSLTAVYAQNARQARLSEDHSKYAENLWKLAETHHYQNDSLRVFQTLLRLQTTLLSISALHPGNKKKIDTLIIKNYLVLSEKYFAYGNYVNAYANALKALEYLNEKKAADFKAEAIWQICKIFIVINNQKAAEEKIDAITLNPTNNNHSLIAAQIVFTIGEPKSRDIVADLPEVFSKLGLEYEQLEPLLNATDTDFSQNYEHGIFALVQNPEASSVIRYHVAYLLTQHALQTEDHENFKKYFSTLKKISSTPITHQWVLKCNELNVQFLTQLKRFDEIHTINRNLLSEKDRLLNQAHRIIKLDFDTKYESLLSGISMLDDKITTFRRILIFSLAGILGVVISTIIIIRTNQKLHAINVAREKLFTIISHDLRSPLVSLNSIINESKTAGREKMRIQREINRLMLLLDNLLYWSARQTSTIKPKFKTIDLNELIEQSLALVETMATQKNIQIHYFDDNESCAYADEDMVSIIIRNILTNAVKYSPANSEVYIETIDSPSLSEIRIKDTGPGFNHKKKDNKSTGLGIPISRELAKINNGKIIFESTRGEGTTVTIILPPPKND